MPLYRCLHPDCAEDAGTGIPAFDFAAEGAEGTCPKCGHSHRLHPDCVVERATIHYLTVDPAGPLRTRAGNRRIACMPLLAKLPKHAANHPAGVTCPNCLASAVLKDHVAGSVIQDVAVLRDDASGAVIPTGPPA